MRRVHWSGRGTWLAALLIVSATAPLRGGSQDPQAAPAAATDVTLRVSVVDGKGQPVPGLGPDAFKVTVGETPRTVKAATFVDLRGAPAAGAPAAGAGGAAPAGRSLYFVIDAASVFPGGERPLVEIARSLLDRLLPEDRAAIVALPGAAARPELTGDAARFEQSLAAIAGKRPADLANFRMGLGEAFGILENDNLMLTNVADRECRVGGTSLGASRGPRQTSGLAGIRNDCTVKLMQDVEQMTNQARPGAVELYRGLLELLASLRDVAGPKSIVLLTTGLTLDRGQEGAFDELGVRAEAADAGVHALLVDVPAGTPGPRMRPSNVLSDRRSLEMRLRDLTNAAGGSTTSVNATSDGDLDRLMQELTGFYRVTFDVEPGVLAATAGKRGPAVRVQAAGRGLTVRARPVLGAARPARMRTVVVPTSDERLAEALRGGSVLRTDLTVRVAGYVTLRGEGAASLLMAGEIEPGVAAAGGASPAAPSGASIGYTLFDDRKQPVAAGVITPGHTQGATVAFAGTLDDLVAGSYVLRVAVADGAGRVGSVERPVEYRPSTGDLQLGDLVFARFEEARTDSLPATGQFGAGDGLGLELDLAGPGAAAADLRTRFVVVKPGIEAPLLELDGVLSAATDGRMRTASALVRPGMLPPGDYEARAIVARGAGTAATVVRPFVVSTERRAGSATAAGTHARASLTEQVWTLVPRFSRQAVLTTEVLEPALARLESGAKSAAVKAALTRLKNAPVAQLLADADLRAADPVAAAFLDGLSAFEKGELETAATRFRAALAQRSDFSPAIAYLAACYAAGGRDREAVGAWQTALALDEDNVAIYRSLVAAFLRLRERSSAEDFLAEAEGKWPRDGDLARLKVVVTLLKDKPADAFALLDASETAGPDVLFVALNLLYNARVAGAALTTADEDRAHMLAYADRYRRANGPQQALVDGWLEAFK